MLRLDIILSRPPERAILRDSRPRPPPRSAAARQPLLREYPRHGAPPPASPCLEKTLAGEDRPSPLFISLDLLHMPTKQMRDLLLGNSYLGE